MSTLHGRRGRMPSRALLAVLPPAAVALVAGCGATDIPSPRPTVTVFVDAPGATRAAGAGASRASSVGTVQPQDSPSSLPTALAAGRQRGAPHSYAEARARLDAAPPTAGVTDGFQSPTGNIRCTLGGSPSLAACEVKKGRIDPPVPSICPPDGPEDIGRIELKASGAFPVCNSDTVGQADEPKLPYGARTASADPVGCLSEEFGVTCVDASTQHGFFLARDTFVTF
ncbi:hypothetical protein [Terrabacter sp. MAHUQ-38]|uniref:hypothetical protein n=1 Tax=unclassified Terrabacter TaxID=2630222 RepID=UPI00165EB52E|nr:hypothetical protein [Terrabacter sp. MAHUQ-38]MBC9821994.1 hypothetical protein [Terrabacter sp. MAHUQ-38]